MITGVVAFIFLISVQYLIIVYDDIFEKDVILGSGLNPPDVVMIAYAFIAMTVIFYYDRLTSTLNNKLLNGFSSILSYVGKHTLYIFLYHLLFVSILGRFISDWNVCLKIPIYYFVLIGGSIAIEMIMKKLKKYFKDSYSYRRELVHGKDNA